MKYCLLALCGMAAFAQSSSTLYSVDINGHVVADAQFAARDGDKTQLNQSVNGGQVPLQSSETKVLSEDPNHRVTETIVQKYDATGRPASTERTVTEESKGPAGASIRASVFRSDLNGRETESERRLIETQVQGGTTTANVTISRVGLNGSFDAAEKRQVVTTIAGDTKRETETINRPSGNGSQFFEAARLEREETKKGNTTTSSTALYEPDYQNKMALSRQDVSTTTKSADGTQVTELNTYAPSLYGVARDEHSGPKLREQQTVVRRQNGGMVTETTTLSHTSPNDPNRLADRVPVSTLVCTGNCNGPLAAATAPRP